MRYDARDRAMAENEETPLTETEKVDAPAAKAPEPAKESEPNIPDDDDAKAPPSKEGPRWLSLAIAVVRTRPARPQVGLRESQPDAMADARVRASR